MPRRSVISLQQKQALRAHKKQHPTLSNLALKQWFEASFQQTIAPSSVSEILSKKYDHLDGELHREPNQKRFRRENWPELEEALFQWIQRAEEHITISGLILREKAEFFWKSLEVYKEKEMPTFSNGWLQGFQQRRRISSYTQYGEARSAQEAIETMNSIRQALSTFEPKDIFNCDETGLLWKLIPDRSLSTRQLPGRRKEKTRVSVHFCVNMDGSSRLPPWFIGKAKNPHAFRAASVNIQNLGIYWRANKKAWMTSTLMEEWLRWFDCQMTGRKVVLLLDNFSAHEAAVEKISLSMQPLQNTLIIWLPPNATSKYQPLDQGIINTWKSYWRREWVRYILHEFEAGRDALYTVDILKAVRWGIKAWNFDISQETITNCFQKGLSIGTEALEDQSQQQPLAEIYQDIQRMQELSIIQEAMDIQNFLNPPEETITDSFESIDEQVLASIQGPSSEEIEDEDRGQEIEVQPLITLSQAREGLQMARLYLEQQEETVDIGVIQLLSRLEIDMQAKEARNRRQGDIRDFFGGFC